MAFIEGFKKFMGMSPLEEEMEDEEDLGEMTFTQPASHDDYGYTDDLDKLDGLDRYDTTPTYSAPVSDMRNYSREDEIAMPNLHQSAALPQVVLVKPERFEDASAIADHLQSKRTVIVNTDSVSQDVRRRLIDFLSGVAYADGGTIKKASNTTFVMTPDTVGVMGESLPDDVDSQEATNSGVYY